LFKRVADLNSLHSIPDIQSSLQKKCRPNLLILCPGTLREIEGKRGGSVLWGREGEVEVNSDTRFGVLFRRGPGFCIIKQASLSHWVPEYNLKVSSVNYQKPRSPSKQHPRFELLDPELILFPDPKLILCR